MRIIFVTMAPVEQGPNGLTSKLASARYRVVMPATQLGRLGHTAQIATLPLTHLPPDMLQVPCDVMVFSKSFVPAHEPLVRAMKARGTRVFADYCDDHFDSAEIGPWFRGLATAADGIVASTPAMAEVIRAQTGREAVVITDPVEGRRGEPKFEPRLPALRIAWFGNLLNALAIVERFGEIKALAERLPIHLTLVTTPNPGVDRLVGDIEALDPTRIGVEFVPWSVDATWKAIADCDVVWIPVASDKASAVKSPNRLVEAAWAGRFVVADSMPAYEPFAPWVSVGQGLEKGVMDAVADPRGVEARLREAQRRIAHDHSGLAVGTAWARALGDSSARPLKLNLGCGDKILPGYVNVDVVEARAGMKPDVVCDLHDLSPFETASADEILSVHVVEHFWRWEIRDVLREWVRVLKPGGKMIVECPNIKSACETFLQNPEQFAREDQNGQRTMWVFYGDPHWKDPLMIHRWGYTPESLKELLAEVGLSEVRQEPAQFKLREPRDMRIVGVKA